MFRENNGKVSFTRVSSFLLILAYIVWATYIVLQTNQIPDLPSEVVWLIGIAYGVNKLAPNIKLQLVKGGQG